MDNYPRNRSLLLCWVILVALTIISMITAMVPDQQHGAGLFGVGLILLLMATKMRLILMTYLNLRIAPRVWRVTFFSFIVVIAMIVWGADLSHR